MRMLCLLLLFITSSSFGMNREFVELAQFRIHPTVPTLGNSATILILPEKFTGDIALKTVVEVSFEGSEAFVEDLGNDIWKFTSPELTEERDYALTAKIYIEDKVQSQITRKEIQKLTVAIERLKNQILLETDEDIRLRLVFEMEEKEGHKKDLQDFLPHLRRYIGEETFQFSATAGQGL